MIASSQDAVGLVIASNRSLQQKAHANTPFRDVRASPREVGPAAKAAVPVVVQSLEDADSRVRKQAVDSLRKIEPEAAKKARLK